MIILLSNLLEDHTDSVRSKFFIRWNSTKPTGCSESKWRRFQIKRYLEVAPEAKRKEIKAWISSHEPNPWPDIHVRELNGIIRRVRNQSECNKQLSERETDPY